MKRVYEDPPVPIMEVMRAALDALGKDGRFKQVPNGHIDIAWRQRRVKKEDEAPPRYFFGIEFMFRP